MAMRQGAIVVVGMGVIDQPLSAEIRKACQFAASWKICRINQFKFSCGAQSGGQDLTFIMKSDINFRKPAITV
jgi:hypothetical protein